MVVSFSLLDLEFENWLKRGGEGIHDFIVYSQVGVGSSLNCQVPGHHKMG